MSDLTERLQAYGDIPGNGVCTEAAARIEALETEVAELRKEVREAWREASRWEALSDE